ncbi:hypothetical protein BJY24_006032 [Nocardia transvalensis]|uniref:Secreted protein n=1 Tax=Nocardia transvalensis TaxID=37333 RepID=A0A7W9PJ87_9NOCA|nr:hypothetical protein [Nocardia transvalensis]MBB5917120.1 hypothetical protein [Nocardia transvalensis]
MSLPMTAHVLVSVTAAFGATALVALTTRSPARTDSGARDNYPAALRRRHTRAAVLE